MKEKFLKEFASLMERAADTKAMSLGDYKDFLGEIIDDAQSLLDAAEEDNENDDDL
jgi:hypothetical protein